MKMSRRYRSKNAHCPSKFGLKYLKVTVISSHPCACKPLLLKCARTDSRNKKKRYFWGLSSKSPAYSMLMWEIILQHTYFTITITITITWQTTHNEGLFYGHAIIIVYYPLLCGGWWVQWGYVDRYLSAQQRIYIPQSNQHFRWGCGGWLRRPHTIPTKWLL